MTEFYFSETGEQRSRYKTEGGLHIKASLFYWADKYRHDSRQMCIGFLFDEHTVNTNIDEIISGNGIITG